MATVNRFKNKAKINTNINNEPETPTNIKNQS
jgi:hypothetical protein